MPRKSDSRKRFVRTMSTLMRRQGYSGTGLAEIIEDSAAPKGSLYFHFPQGKEQLAAEAITASGESIRRLIVATLASAPDAPTAVRFLATGLGGVLAASGYTDGCPIATVALEAATTSGPIRAASAEAFKSWEDGIAARLVEFGWPAPDAASAATLVLSSLEGALVLSRAYQDTAPFTAVGEVLARTLANPPSSNVAPP